MKNTIDGKVFKAKKEHVIAIGEPRKSEEDARGYKFTVELTSGLYLFVVWGSSIKGLIANPNHPKIETEQDAMQVILGHKIARFIGRSVKYGRENATDTSRNHSEREQS